MTEILMAFAAPHDHESGYKTGYEYASTSLKVNSLGAWHAKLRFNV